MEKTVVRVVSGLAIVVAIAWFLKEGGFEPAVTALGGLTGMLHSFFEGSTRRERDPVSGDGSPRRARRASRKKKKIHDESKFVEDYLNRLRSELEGVIRKSDEAYYEIYEKHLQKPDIFTDNPAMAERLKLSVIVKVALVQLFALCQEQIKLRETVGSDETFEPVWRIEPEPDQLVRDLTAETHQLVQGATEAFHDYLKSFRLNESAVNKMIALSQMPARRVFQIDGKTNERKRRSLEELIRLKASAEGIVSAA